MKNNSSDLTIRRNLSGIRWRWVALTIVVTLWLLGMTLRPGFTPNGVNLVPFAENGRAVSCLFNAACLYRRVSLWTVVVNIMGNVIAFIPLGMGLAGLYPHRRAGRLVLRAALGGGLLSLVIELLQLTIPTRATDIDDIILNTLGAAVGAGIFLWLNRMKSGD
ncbi:MAG: VanZ family protein [Chloroflexi bacterium]|nr:MAG: VanZ family protein [Chloroflexota bacterium]